MRCSFMLRSSSSSYSKTPFLPTDTQNFPQHLQFLNFRGVPRLSMDLRVAALLCHKLLLGSFQPAAHCVLLQQFGSLLNLAFAGQLNFVWVLVVLLDPFFSRRKEAFVFRLVLLLGNPSEVRSVVLVLLVEASTVSCNPNLSRPKSSISLGNLGSPKPRVT